MFWLQFWGTHAVHLHILSMLCICGNVGVASHYWAPVPSPHLQQSILYVWKQNWTRTKGNRCESDYWVIQTLLYYNSNIQTLTWDWYHLMLSAVLEIWTKQVHLFPVCVLTCIALIFSNSWSVLEAPSRTEFTPSFLRHHAVGMCRTEDRWTQ